MSLIPNVATGGWDIRSETRPVNDEVADLKQRLAKLPPHWTVAVLVPDPERGGRRVAWAAGDQWSERSPAGLSSVGERFASPRTDSSRSVEAFRNAFGDPQFQATFARYPDSTVASPHLFQKTAVPSSSESGNAKRSRNARSASSSSFFCWWVPILPWPHVPMP